MRENEQNDKKKQYLMFEEEVQKQLLSNIIHYHYRISWILQMQI